VVHHHLAEQKREEQHHRRPQQEEYSMQAEEIGYTDPAQDKFTQRKMSDSRKPKITLAHLNRLKKMRAAKDLETLMRQDLMQLMYSAPTEEAGGMGL